MSKHTAGPWSRNIKPATKYNTIFAGRNRHVCHLATGLSLEETEANCDLIKSAPELLRALETLAAYANGRLGANPYLIPEYKQALVAIGKAKGMSTDSDKWMDANGEADKKENAKRQ
jgi:hypothetical protein